MGRPLRLKPHHAEGAQRYMRYPMNESHASMLHLLEAAVAADPNAELLFVRGFDAFCEGSCIEAGKEPPCAIAYGSPDIVSRMDEEVAREHGWKFDRPYSVQRILAELRAEAPDRDIFYICQLTDDEHARWLQNVRASKKQ